ncbi:TniQ family protein [Paenibacillus sp. B01]|uniref:TniQ family protein n=1 Tax=Paenibacillus sp. B01 TaxID=2660554 RepID=UPI00129AE92B|nr:TniQ family protein [Paenibacillus sp. B01]QGG55064.1 hypothetical protein GE073_05345 [Paenibacillus sp. B01]
MDDILTVKTRPYEGESVTAFLLRTAVRNYLPYGELLKQVKIKQTRSQHLDMNPELVTDFKKLLSLLDISDREFNCVSLGPVVEMFLDNQDRISEEYRNFLYEIINTTHRRFCPLCLKEKNCYKLLWQINELVVCDHHKVKLTSKCPTCQKEQPYIHPAHVEVRCYSCNSRLDKQIDNYEIIDDDVFTQQYDFYGDWYSLLENNKDSYFSKVHSKSKYIALLAIYFNQNKETQFNMLRITRLSNDYRSRLVSYFQREEGYKPTLGLVLNTIRKNGTSVSEFLETEVPSSYIYEVMNYDSRAEVVPVCQSPWCSAFGSSERMLRSEKKYLRWNGNYYYRPHMCLQCFVKYGYIEKDLMWYECGETIEFAWRRIHPLLSEGFYELDIANQLSITRYTVLKYAVYFASQSASGKTINGKEALEFFKTLSEYKDGSDIARASKLFGWGQRKYFYYYFTPEVQSYLFLLVNPNKGASNKKNTKKMDTFKEFPRKKEKVIRIDEKIMRSKAQEYIEKQIANEEIISDIPLYSFMGTSKKTVNRYYPDLLEWIEVQKKRQEEIIVREIEQKRIEQINEAITFIVNSGEYPSIERVVELSGVPKKYIRTHKEVKAAFEEKRTNIQVNIKWQRKIKSKNDILM